MDALIAKLRFVFCTLDVCSLIVLVCSEFGQITSYFWLPSLSQILKDLSNKFTF
uniref:Uncharacterized protein n=1 Tax=Rhizophora mucronata TaxID=61149 RepID=A0A2P2N097_RHIMU